VTIAVTAASDRRRGEQEAKAEGDQNRAHHPVGGPRTHDLRGNCHAAESPSVRVRHGALLPDGSASAYTTHLKLSRELHRTAATPSENISALPIQSTCVRRSAPASVLKLLHAHRSLLQIVGAATISSAAR